MNNQKNMNNQNEKQIQLVNGQIIGIILFILTLIVSVIIAYNEKLIRENKSGLFSNKDALNISLINRIVVVILGIYFVYDAYERQKVSNSYDDPNSNLQILASWLALIASAIIVYIIVNNYKNINFDVSEIEEPTL